MRECGCDEDLRGTRHLPTRLGDRSSVFTPGWPRTSSYPLVQCTDRRLGGQPAPTGGHVRGEAGQAFIAVRASSSEETYVINLTSSLASIFPGQALDLVYRYPKFGKTRFGI